MRIAILGPLWINIPPPAYGGTEQIVYHLANGLTENGHDVTLFGPQTAKVKTKVFATVQSPLRERDVPWTNIGYTLYHITQAFDRLSDFDILHVQLNRIQDYIALPLACFSRTPILFTSHSELPTPSFLPDAHAVLMKYGKLPFTSISDSQRNNLPVNFIDTVYNGIPIEQYPFSAQAKDYFIWVGRVDRKKGTKEAILAAKKAGVQLYILGHVEEGVPEKLAYYENEIKPLIDNKQIIWKADVSVEEKAKLLGQAKGFLNPITWREPFGLVMAESQATGTPVISFANGAAPEIIVEGKTGYLVKTLDEMVERMKIIDKIDRDVCRKHIEEKFTRKKMLEGYELAYQTVTQQWQEYLKNQQRHILEQKMHPVAL